MAGFVVAFLVGVVCIVLGIGNMRGNISSLHSYHRHRVREEDRAPLGRMVGLGTVIIGTAVSLFGILSSVTYYTNRQIFMWIGMGIMGVGFAVGLALSFYAMIKYNKGIF